MTASEAEPSRSTTLTAEVVAAFVANNSLPIGDLPSLIHAVRGALENSRQSANRYNAAAGETRAGSFGPQVDHARFHHMSRRRKELQIAATPFEGARNESGGVSGEVESSGGLSDGRAKLCSAAIGNGQVSRARPASQKRSVEPEGNRQRTRQARTGSQEKSVSDDRPGSQCAPFEVDRVAHGATFRGDFATGHGSDRTRSMTSISSAP